MNRKQPINFKFEKLAESCRKEIAELGALLKLIYEQQNCLVKYNPVSLLHATSKIEAQLPVNQLATADRVAFMQQLAEEMSQESIQLNELPKIVPLELKTLFEALVDEIISLRLRIKNKTNIQQKLLGQTQMINNSIIQKIIPNDKFYNEHKHSLYTLTEFS